MDIKLNIGLAELMQLIMQLPKAQRERLVAWMAEDEKTQREQVQELLLRAPTFSKAQLQRLSDVRAAIDQWR
jgi:hypothetical protein